MQNFSRKTAFFPLNGLLASKPADARTQPSARTRPLLFIESGGDNLSATFSPELVDATIFVIDVSEGDKIPRKGGPGITRSDLLVINKIDLAPYVGASLEVMERDSEKMRQGRPFLFTNIRSGEHVDDVIQWLKKNVLLEGM